MAKMKAVVAYGAKDFRLEEVEIPKVEAGEVLIRVNATGICASDRSIYNGGDPWGGVRSPHIPGHEFAGTVVELGAGAAEVTGLQIGDQATQTAFINDILGFDFVCIQLARFQCMAIIDFDMIRAYGQ